jgi:hypothetical protein
LGGSRIVGGWMVGRKALGWKWDVMYGFGIEKGNGREMK